MGRIEEPASRAGLELLELTRAGLDAAMPAGKGAGAGDSGKNATSETLLFFFCGGSVLCSWHQAVGGVKLAYAGQMICMIYSHFMV